MSDNNQQTTPFKWHHRGPDIESDLALMTYDELITEQGHVGAVLAEIREQIRASRSHYHDTGERADPEWWRRVHSAQKLASLRFQAILRRLAILKKERAEQADKRRAADDATREARLAERRRRGESFTQTFVDVCRKMLAPDVFEKIEAAAKQEYQLREGV